MIGVELIDRVASTLEELVHDARHRLPHLSHADVNAEMKADARGKLGPLGETLEDTRLHPVEIRRDTIAAVYDVDPRVVELGAMVRETTDVSRDLSGLDPRLKFNYVSTLTQ